MLNAWARRPLDIGVTGPETGRHFAATVKIHRRTGVAKAARMLEWRYDT
jgi:hypothetical protein